MKNILIATCLFLSLAAGRAEVTPNGLFTHNMVLQQGVPIPVWGVAKEGEKVTVECEGQSVSTNAKAGK